MGVTWSDFGSSEQRKGHVKSNPDPGQHSFTTLLGVESGQDPEGNVVSGMDHHGGAGVVTIAKQAEDETDQENDQSGQTESVIAMKQCEQQGGQQ